MKTQLKVLSLLAAALAVVFSTAGVSMAFSAPGEMAYCHLIDSGLSFECDPVSNLVVVNSAVIPVTGLGLPSFTTSLRGVNNFTPSATELILADFIANPSVVATSLRGINEIALSATGLNQSDVTTLQQNSDENMKELPLMEDYYPGFMYGGGY